MLSNFEGFLTVMLWTYLSISDELEKEAMFAKVVTYD